MLPAVYLLSADAHADSCAHASIAAFLLGGSETAAQGGNGAAVGDAAATVASYLVDGGGGYRSSDGASYLYECDLNLSPDADAVTALLVDSGAKQVGAGGQRCLSYALVNAITAKCAKE